MSDLSRVVSVRLDEDLADRLTKRAEQQGCTVSDLIRAQVVDALSPLPTVRYAPSECVCPQSSRSWPSPAAFTIPESATFTYARLVPFCGTCSGPLPTGWALTVEAVNG